MRHNYDAAVVCSGFSGFSLGSTPTAMSKMATISNRYGASNLAFIIVPLVCVFFIDLVNALLIPCLPAIIDEAVWERARTLKGRRTLQAILDATCELITSEGLAGASQEAIAKRANVTQSAVQHYYFPRKNDLLDAFFLDGIERLIT